MNQVLFAVRYVLMITGIVATLYVSSIESYTAYTFGVLSFIAIDINYNRWKRLPKHWFVLALISIGTGLSAVYGGFLFLLCLSVLFLLRPNPRGTANPILAVIDLIAMNSVIYGESAGTLILANLMFLIIAAAIMLTGSVVRQKEEIQALYDRLRQHHYELDEARTRLVEYAQKVENIAQVEERNRISKDIHDELGHKLIRIKLMTEALIRVIPQDLEKGMEILYQVRDSLSEGMETLRSTVRKWKPGDAALRSFSLQRLAEDFYKESGVRVEFKVSGEPFPLYPSVEVALYRNAQEALTNAVRHGKAASVFIRLEYGPERITMSISNDGRLPEGTIAKGLGLRGMEERIELLGGTVETEATDRFTVRSIVPLRNRAIS